MPTVLDWAQKLQSIAQTGLAYDPQPYDRQRYEQILDIAVAMLEANSDSDAAAIRALFDAQIGYATPKTDVRGVVFRVGKLLVVQEKMVENRWTLPGGCADVGDAPSAAAVREIREETGYSSRAVKLLALYDRNKHGHPPYIFHAYKAFFQCELTDPERHPDPHNIETGDVGFFSEDELPELSLARVTGAQIARFFEHLRQPDLPTDFD